MKTLNAKPQSRKAAKPQSRKERKERKVRKVRKEIPDWVFLCEAPRLCAFALKIKKFATT